MHPYFSNQYTKGNAVPPPITTLPPPHRTVPPNLAATSHPAIAPNPQEGRAAGDAGIPLQNTPAYGNDKSRKKRTKKDRACDLCRRKKIRCDYDLNYPQKSCASCRGYGKVCTFNEAAKKRGPPKGYVESLENRLRRMEELLLNVAGANHTLDALSDQSRASDSDNETESECTRQSTPEPTNTASTTSTKKPETMTPFCSVSVLEKRKGHQQQKRSLDTVDNAKRQKRDMPYSYVGSSSGIYLLRKMLDDPSDAFESKDNDLMVAFLDQDQPGKDTAVASVTYDLPDKEVVDRLVEIYFKRMNMFLPIVDETDFYEKYHGKTAGLSVPLLVAICRSACRLLDEDDWVVKKHNIERGKLFKDLSQQMVKRFDIDILQPNIVTIQVLLLITASAEKWGTESIDWIGLGIAVKMAQDLGLHRGSTQWPLGQRDNEPYKRLWWSAYVLDRWICATLGRPMTISDADCDVELPSLETEEQRRTSLFLVHLVKLSNILGDVLRLMCSPRARKLMENQSAMEKLCHNLEATIRQWENNLPEQLSLSPSERRAIKNRCISNELEAKLNNGAGQLYLAFLSVILLLKRPFISMGRSQSSSIEMPHECHVAIQNILTTVECMRIKSLFSFSWSLSSYFVSQGWILNVLNLRNKDPKIVANTQKYLEIFTNQYHRLESYITEPSLIPFLRTLAKMAADDSESTADASSDKGAVTSSSVTQEKAQEDAKNDPRHSPAMAPMQILHENFFTQEQEAVSSEALPLWGASSGLNWQDLMLLLGESGYDG